MTLRIAMWSGPRNISTAMMRSWENRPDCTVVDEPFYACYLRESSVDHPYREEILAAQSSDRSEVVAQLTTAPATSELFYQKHMTHHIPRGMDMDWCAQLQHCFLIRDPNEVIVSYLKKMPSISEDAIGIVRQADLFDEITAIRGVEPLVIDSNDVLRNPDRVLGKLCEGLSVPFLPDAMLHWPKGRRDSDGVWASHWYQNVEASTGFARFQQQDARVPAKHRELAERMVPLYEKMASRRLR